MRLLSTVLLLLLSTAPAMCQQVFYRSEAEQSPTEETYPCGVMSENLDTHKLPRGTTVSPADGKALVYVFVGYGGIYQNRIAVDGRWVGATKGKGYIAAELDPGEHRVCAKLRTVAPAVSKLKVEPGKTYFLRVWFVTRSAFGKIKFEIMDDAEGQQELSKNTFYATTLKKN